MKAESLRIRTRLYSDNHQFVGISADLLAGIFMSKDEFGYETKELLERWVFAITVKYFAPERTNTVIGYASLGQFRYQSTSDIRQTVESRIEHSCLSKSKYTEAQRIFSKILDLALI